MANQSIVLVGLGSQPLPGVYVELDFAKGPVAGSGAARGCLLMGNMTTSGSATPDTVVYGALTPIPCQTEADVIGLFGSGSQLHRMFLRFMKAAGTNTSIPIFFLAVTASAGAAATVVETITTNAATNGNHRTWCVDQFVDTPITVGDTPTTIAGNVINSVNSQTSWPVIASNVAGVVTYTAKVKGPEGNWIRMMAAVQSSGTIATTTSLTANTFATGGTTADVNTTALGTIAGTRYYGIVSGDSDATNVGRLVTQVGQQALPTVGIRQRAYFGSMDTLGNTVTIATGINNPRAECLWGNATDCTPAELAAGCAALYMSLEQGSQFGVNRKNFSLFPTNPTDAASWPFVAGRGGTAGAPTTAQLNAALANGITPITALSNGTAQLVKGITTYSIGAGGAADYRIRDRHRVSVCDYWCDDVQAMTQGQFGGRDLLPDIVQGQDPPPKTAVTPSIWGDEIKSITLNYGNAGQWKFPPGVTAPPNTSPADVLNSLMQGPQIETNPINRMSVGQPLSPCDIFDQAAILASQVG